MSQERSGGFAALKLISTLLIVSPFLVAQSDTASITGFVRDASGAVIPNANVVIRNESTGADRKTVSNRTGYYIVPNLTPGMYTISVDAAGFKKFESTQNKLDPNITATV